MQYSTKTIIETISEQITLSRQSETEGWNEEYEARQERLDSIIEQAKLELSQSTYKDYNAPAFKELIKTIEANGLANFNMATFWGHFNENNMVYYDYVHEISRSSLTNHVDPNLNKVLDERTSSFNCTSVGCIAGFATAVAMDWTTPKWIEGDSREYHHQFEVISCSYLNIPIWVGKRIFYGDEESAWAFAKKHSHLLGDAYSHLKLEEGSEDDFEDDWGNYMIDLNSISYKDAVNLLSDIIEGRILFGFDFEHGITINPSIVKNYHNQRAGVVNE